MSLSDPYLKARSCGNEFASTHWSVVLMAGKEPSTQSAQALEKLCRAYWYPLYSFVRRRGYDPHEAADLTQEFFSRLLAANALATVRSEKGRFRSFLLASMKNLLANEWNRARSQKRGGGVHVFSLDETEAEGRYRLEPVDHLSPDKIFDRRWAEIILSRALQNLRRECDEVGKSRRFDAVKRFLIKEKGGESMVEVADRLNMSLAAVKALIHRLRRRFRELIGEEIAQTVSNPQGIEQEIRDLFTAFED